MPTFSSKYRLISKHDFQAVFADAKKVSFNQLIILYRPNQLGFARLGIIIPKHHAPTAVLRNRFRRIIRESFRHQRETLSAMDMIVMMRSKYPSGTDKKTANKQFREMIDQLWLRIPTNLIA